MRAEKKLWGAWTYGTVCSTCLKSPMSPFPKHREKEKKIHQKANEIFNANFQPESVSFFFFFVVVEGKMLLLFLSTKFVILKSMPVFRICCFCTEMTLQWL